MESVPGQVVLPVGSPEGPRFLPSSKSLKSLSIHQKMGKESQPGRVSPARTRRSVLGSSTHFPLSRKQSHGHPGDVIEPSAQEERKQTVVSSQVGDHQPGPPSTPIKVCAL